MKIFFLLNTGPFFEDQMQTKIPEQLKEQIIELKLSGHTNSEISKVTNVSTGKISEITNDFAERLGRQEYDFVITFCRIFKKGRLNLQQAFEGFQMSAITKRFNLDTDQLGPFLSQLEKECIKGRITPEKVVDSLISLMKIKESLDIEIEDLPAACDELVENRDGLLEEVHALQSNVAKMRKDLEEAARDRNLTVVQVKELSKYREFLEKIGLSISELPKAANVFVQASSLGYDPKKILDYLAREGDFEKRISSRKTELNRLENLIHDTEAQLKVVSGDLESLTLKYNRYKTLVDIIEDIRKNGINPLDIVSWNEILKLAGVPIQEFSRNLQKAGGILNYIREIQSKLDQLERKGAVLESQCNNLSTQKMKLLKEIAEIQETKFKEWNEILANVSKASEELGRMGFMKPLSDLMHELKGKPVEVYLSMVFLLERLDQWMEIVNTRLTVRSCVKSLIDELRRQVNVINRQN